MFSRYAVLDEKGECIYKISGKNTPSGESVRIRDKEGNTLCKIRRLGFSALSAYSISEGGLIVGLNVAASAGRASVRFRGISFSICGDVLTGSYDIRDADNTVVCSVRKDYRKGYILLDVNIKERERFCIAAAVCIDSLSMDAQPAMQMT